jgi:hypothetical protein
MTAIRKADRLAVEKFDPAPHDKHAVDPKQAAHEDLALHSPLSLGLLLTFPASDPISLLQPASPSRAGR